jgi:hypothetical protein
MKRRDFFEKTGCGVMGLMLAHFGLKLPLSAHEHPDREKMVMKMLMEKMGKTEGEAKMMIEDFKKKLPEVQQMCVCRGCPSYVKDETVVGFCHPLVGKSKVIKKEKGCICGSCPVYKKMKLTKGYYCTRASEMEQKMMK